MKRFIILAAAVITVFTASRAFAQNDALPSDVSPDSRNRVPLLKQKMHLSAQNRLTITRWPTSQVHNLRGHQYDCTPVQ
jgi:hypothetical protein